MPTDPQPLLVLASASPRRRHLLERLGVAVDVLPADVVEWEDPAADPEELVRHNCRLKAEWASRQRPDETVLAADTTVALDGHVLNKPADLDEARAMLKRLAGRTHTVFTGVAMMRSARAANGGKFSWQHISCVSSAVTFHPLDDATIDAYFRIVNPLDKAGAYGIQEGRKLIVDEFDGSFTNIMGLPVETIAALLIEADYDAPGIAERAAQLEANPELAAGVA